MRAWGLLKKRGVYVSGSVLCGVLSCEVGECTWRLRVRRCKVQGCEVLCEVF